MSKIKAIIFDLDGLLVDTEPLFLTAMQSVLRRYGIDVAARDYIAMDLQNGTSVLEQLYIAGRIGGIKPIQSEIYKVYFDLLQHDMRAMPGATDTVRRLEHDFLLAIASSSKVRFINYILERLSLQDSFKIVVARESTRNLKPEPDCLELVLRKANLTAQECVLIEDSRRGLAAAKTIGMPCIVIPNALTRDAEYPGATAVLSSLKDLTSELILSV